MMSINVTFKWGKHLQILAEKPKNTDPENRIVSKISNIDTGDCVLVSNLKQDTRKYPGFALIFKHLSPGNYQWLQFVTRQLVVNGNYRTGDLVTKINTQACKLVESKDKVCEYENTNKTISNWNACWKVDGRINNPFFPDEYDFAQNENITAILCTPEVFVGRKPTHWESEIYQDLPPNPVNMKDLLTDDCTAISRAYFSDYLLRKGVGKSEGKWKICARFDFSLTWLLYNTTPDKNAYQIECHFCDKTVTLLECHKKAWNRKTIPGDTTIAPAKPYPAFKFI